jgi:DNA-binding transcriptional regulator LsrR (DeoR family)
MPMQRGFDERMIWHAAILRYLGEKELSHAQIAKKMKIKRVMVTRLLSRAQSEGYIKMIVAPPKERQLELQLIDRYNLLDAYVAKIPSDDLPPSVLTSIVGEAGATCFHKHLELCVEAQKKKSHKNHLEEDSQPLTIGLAGGKTIAAVTQALSHETAKAQVFPLAATLTDIGHYGPESICSSFVAHYSAEHAVMVPGFYLLAELDEKEERIVRFSLVPKEPPKGLMFDLALVGIGATRIEGSTCAQAINLIPNPIRLKILDNKDGKKIVGDIAGTLIYEDGSLGDNYGYSDNLISVGPDRLREMHQSSGGNSKIIAVASGLDKVHAIRAALLGGNSRRPDPYFNVFVTDQFTAEELLK